MTVIEVLQGSQGCWCVSGTEFNDTSVHASKAAAVRFAQMSLKKAVAVRIRVHNEDGSIDLLEHGFGNPDKTPPQFLASTSGSTFPMVEESIGNLLSRGAQAVMRKNPQG